MLHYRTNEAQRAEQTKRGESTFKEQNSTAPLPRELIEVKSLTEGLKPSQSQKPNRTKSHKNNTNSKRNNHRRRGNATLEPWQMPEFK